MIFAFTALIFYQSKIQNRHAILDLGIVNEPKINLAYAEIQASKIGITGYYFFCPEIERV